LLGKRRVQISSFFSLVFWMEWFPPEMPQAFPLSRAFSQCKGLSDACNLGLRNFNVALKLVLAEKRFLRSNEACFKEGLAPCWDSEHKHIKTGICEVEECLEGREKLQEVCFEVEHHQGSLCDWSLGFGLGGTSILTKQPVCIPESCTNARDVSKINSCVLRHSCDMIPEELLPECKVKLQCGESIDLQPYFKVGIIGLVALLFLGVAVFMLMRRFNRLRKEVSPSLETALLSSRFAVEEGRGDPVLPQIMEEELVEEEDDEGTTMQSSSSHFRVNAELESHIRNGIELRVAHDGSRRAESLLWRNISFKRDGVQVLRGVTGFLRRGAILAVIGAPDSGATTLLKILAGRVSGGEIWGDVLLDGQPRDRSWVRKIAYIPKEDFNLPMLTVRETLSFSLSLRSRFLTPELREERVDATLQLLGLSHCADTIVGDQTVRGISGGEKRRVSIGVEAIAGSPIQIMDSVTNGLDSAAAFDVIKALKALAESGLNCSIATVRQPSLELLGLFDQVCLISRGSCIYFGPLDKAEDYFANAGYRRPKDKSLPDFLEELTGDASQFWAPQAQTGTNSIPLRRLQSTLRLDLVEAYKVSSFFKRQMEEIWQELERTNQDDDNLTDEEILRQYEQHYSFLGRIRKYFRDYCNEEDRYDSTFSGQLWVCFHRQAKITIRSPTVKAKMLRAIVMAVVVGTSFAKMSLDQRDARNRFSLMFIVVTSICMGGLAIIPQLFAQRVLFYHQSHAGYFRATAYLAAIITCEVPLFLFEAFLFSIILYPLCGLNSGVFSENFIYFVLTHAFVNWASFSLCVLAVISVPSVAAATAAAPTLMSVMILFAGYLVQRSELPVKFVYDISLVSRPFKGLVLNEMEGLIFKCEESELVPPLEYPNSTVKPPNGFWGPDYRTCPIQTGSTSLYLFGLNFGELDKWVLFQENLWFIVIFNLLALVAMWTLSYAPDSSDAAVQVMKNRLQTRLLKAKAKRADYNLESSNNEAEGDVEHLEEDDIDGSPRESGSIEFKDLNYTIHIPQGRCQKPKKGQILFNVSGHVQGRILGLLGKSGAGKSTLLDVLANKKTSGEIDAASLLVNGRARDKFFPRFAGYVEQMDSHLPTTTVLEAIRYSAALRLGEVSVEEIKRKCLKVIRRLGLAPFASEMIGSSEQAFGVSQEIRKKVTIALELVFEPVILFLDEPTTGLDGKSALNIMECIREAAKDLATICTVHQPSAECFALFDWALILQTGGRVCYFGPIDRMLQYFAQQGFEPCNPERNPADYALECSTREDAADLYDASEWKGEVLAQAPSYQSRNQEKAALQFSSEYAAGVFRQFRIQLEAQLMYQFRDFPLMFVRCFTAVLTGLLIGFLFFKLGHGQTDAQARIGLIFIAMLYGSYSAILSIPKIVDQRPVQFREYSSNYYRLWVHYVAMSIADIPVLLLQISLFCFTFYPMVQLRGGGNFAFFYVVVLVHAYTAFGFSSFIAMFSPNADVGTIINIVLNGLFTLMCGFLLPYKSIPPFWRPLYYLAFHRYSLSVLVSNEMHGATFDCGPHGNETALPIFVGGLSQTTPPPPFGLGPLNPRCVIDAARGIETLLNDPYCFKNFCPIIEGDFLLERFSFPMTEQDIIRDVIILCVFSIVFRILAFITLKSVQYVVR